MYIGRPTVYINTSNIYFWNTNLFDSPEINRLSSIKRVSGTQKKQRKENRTLYSSPNFLIRFMALWFGVQGVYLWSSALNYGFGFGNENLGLGFRVRERKLMSRVLGF